MIQTVGLYEFRRAFETRRPDNFSYEGQGLLFEYLEDCDPQYDLDVIGLCCDYTEDNNRAIAADRDIDIDGLDEDEACEAVLAALSEETCVVGTTCDGRIIYANY